MSNTRVRGSLYSASQIGEILKIVRERACQEEQRTKTYFCTQLGITQQRLTNIESGFSAPPFELAADWCRLVGDHTALSKIKHIYRVGLPATDPRLLISVPNQLQNLIQQAEGAIKAAETLLSISKDMRPGRKIKEAVNAEIEKLAEEVLDLQQAAEATLLSMSENWKLDLDKVMSNWTQEALVDQVIIPSVGHFDDIKKQTFFAKRALSLDLGGV
ncbi:sporulation sigma factor-processing peptidase [Bacillus sp. JJ722]|uniref:sporulation sigma factor-processing peptidase n=1 Tax=Bacillus sp. JJ722 TaxID=3122973 RepID=UPI0030006ECE